MRIVTKTMVICLSKRRKDGWRTVERIRLLDWSPLLPEMKKVPHRVRGKRLQVWYHRSRQLKLLFAG